MEVVGSRSCCISARVVLASSAEFLYSVSLFISSLAFSMTWFASKMVCSGVSVVPGTVLEETASHSS